MNRVYGDDFGFETVTEGTFEDQGCKVKTIVVRLSASAMNEWIMSSVLNCRETYDTYNEWETYKEKKNQQRIEWNKKILQKLGFTQSEGFSISQSVSEIFTIVLFERLTII